MQLRRLAATDDVAALTALLHAAYAPLAAAGFRYVASYQDEATTLARAARGECWVVPGPGGAVVATVTVHPPSRTGGCAWYDRPDVASFGQFAVAPALQRTGLGSALLDHACTRAVEMGAAELACDTAADAAALRSWYERRGFRPVDHVDWPVTNYVSVVLSRTLT